ncbi:hypothetical protein [Hymenobacter terrenus]|uniref:hypothetical protein n=1 Tax=Hymenobacter terrenus TaxID=1629124 RepID=UPI0006194A36|nr:hypothetical protein [Hymenobacter terrenus]
MAKTTNTCTYQQQLRDLQADHESLTTDFLAVCDDLRLVTDRLLQVNAFLQDPDVAKLLREREHEQRVLQTIANC